jgi:protein-tyrosine-phosphatase
MGFIVVKYGLMVPDFRGTMSWLEQRYGGRRQLLTHVAAGIRLRAGGWRAEQNVNWSTVRRVVFICSGNICRSPYAAERARLLGIESASCGLAASMGAGADPVAARNAAKRHVDLSSHRSRPYDGFDVMDGDLLVMFEPNQVTTLNGRSAGAQVTLHGLWALRPQPYIADPYGRSDSYFQHCFTLIDQGVATIAERLAARTAVAS